MIGVSPLSGFRPVEYLTSCEGERLFITQSKIVAKYRKFYDMILKALLFTVRGVLKLLPSLPTFKSSTC